MTPPRVTYLVSGAEDVKHCIELLRRTGRPVKGDREVDTVASAELKPGKRYVIVAHGASSGRVMWSRSDSCEPLKWLWVGMRQPPKNVRLYLYSCHAGLKLARHLKHCECFGHSDAVPTPNGSADDIVLEYLDKVDEVVRKSRFDREKWRQVLGEFVNNRLVTEVESLSAPFNVFALLVLRKSLGFSDEHF